MSSVDRLNRIMSDLPPELQDEVVSYARQLLESAGQAPGKGEQARFYICPVCFAAASAPLECHGHVMVACTAENIEDCKPLMNEDGDFVSPAPRWFISAIRQAVRLQSQRADSAGEATA